MNVKPPPFASGTTKVLYVISYGLLVFTFVSLRRESVGPSLTITQGPFAYVYLTCLVVVTVAFVFITHWCESSDRRALETLKAEKAKKEDAAIAQRAKEINPWR